jgi:predicted esterase
VSVSLVAGGKELASKSYPLKAFPARVVLPLKGNLAEGDYALRVRVSEGGRTLAELPEQTVSFVADLDGRRKALGEALDALPKPAGVDAESAHGLLAVLNELAAKKALETNYPAARLLGEAEAAAKAVAAKQAYYGKDRPGEFWLKLPGGKEPAAVRVFVPEGAKPGNPLPLVIALHGAGGSENLFFDGYGRGAAVRLCRERGWLLVAPRTAGFAFTASFDGLIDDLAKLYPVDRKRVFVVGHSMGAAQAVSAAQASPECFAGVAALGGGGAVQKSDKLKAVPFFVGVGAKDFALGMARALKKGLEQAGVTTVQYREYPEIEHLVIVQAVLPEVFAFFDKCAAPKKE